MTSRIEYRRLSFPFIRAEVETPQGKIKKLISDRGFAFVERVVIARP